MSAPDPMANVFAMMRPRKVCVCRQVSEEQIRDAVRNGADTFDAVQRITNCGTGCGTCESQVRTLIHSYLES